MLNTYFCISNMEGNFLGIKTLDYCYPYSLVLVEYNVGGGNKHHYSYMGYDSNGRFVVKTKNMVHNIAKEMIINNIGNCRFINKWKEL